MNSYEQLNILKQLLIKKTNCLYDKDFIMKLSIALSLDHAEFEKKLNIIDTFNALFDESVMLINPKRAMNYLCCIYVTIDELKSCVNKVADDFERKKLATLSQ